MSDNNDSTVKIDSLEMENVKRVKAVRIECKGKPLTVIGGRNNQGKTTVLDGICYTLGGERFKPSNLQRDDALAYPELRVNLSNGLLAERKGKNSSLKVTDQEGNTGGQSLLKKFIPEFALNLPKFLNAKPSEKADILLKIIGVGDKLKKLQSDEEKLYDKRHAYGQIADQKKKYADELPTYPDAPDAIITAKELIQSQQEILARNGENQKKRERVQELILAHGNAFKEMARLRDELEKAEEEVNRIETDLRTATKTAKSLQDESTEEVEAKLDEIDAINVRVRANLDKDKANEEAEEYRQTYEEMTEEIENIRAEKKALLEGANLPLPGLSVENGELVYQGKAWDCMSGSDQLRVATAIVRRLNPKCGFVLIDKLEALDVDTLREFGQWLEKEGLQAITTRVGQGEECSIIIEDGFSIEDGRKTFVHGEF